MHNGKAKKSKHILTIALASLIVLSATSAAVMSGCGENSESTNETKTVSETELVTVVVDETYATDSKGNTVPAENKGSDTSSNGNSQNSANSSSQKTHNSGSSANSSAGGSNSNNSASSSNNSGNNNNNNNSNSSGNNSSSSSNKTNTPSSNTHKPVTDSNVCNLDGNKFAVGDTVTCVYKLTSPEKLEIGRAHV